jgi:16S rRNA (guanine1207-N2)-methyltransferase
VAPDDYYTFRTFTGDIAGRRLAWVGKPGVPAWDEIDASTRLLAETAETAPGTRVLALGCGTGLAGAVLARAAGEVVLADASVPAIECARRTLAANGTGNARVELAPGVPAADGAYDVIAAHLPRGTALAERLLREAGAALRVGGRLYLAGHKLSGIKTFIDRAAELFGSAHTLRTKASCRVAVATKTGPIAPPEDDGYVTRAIVLDGAGAQLVAAPGVFAWEGLDAGTAALVAAMEIAPGARVLDLGCGSGLAGLAAARRGAGRVVLVDADVRAVEAARRTLAANGVTNARVLPSDCAQAVRGQAFDTVITNPPFHQGRGVEYDVALQFIRDAHAALVPGGRLYLVANAFLPYERELQAVFGGYTQVSSGRKFKVLMASQ